MYLFLAVLGPHCCMGFLELWWAGAPLWLQCLGFFCCGAWALEQGLSSCSEIFLDQGSSLCPLCWQESS